MQYNLDGIQSKIVECMEIKRVYVSMLLHKSISYITSLSLFISLKVLNGCMSVHKLFSIFFMRNKRAPGP